MDWVALESSFGNWEYADCQALMYTVIITRNKTNPGK